MEDTTKRVAESWGPHHSAIEDGTATCADYLGRMQRSLSGEAAPDRHYFSMRANDLQVAARDLVRLTEEVEGWLVTCAAQVPAEGNDDAFDESCELPAGHRGPHDPDALPSLANQVRDAARALSAEAAEAAEAAAWVNKLGLHSDRRQSLGSEKFP